MPNSKVIKQILKLFLFHLFIIRAISDYFYEKGTDLLSDREPMEVVLVKEHLLPQILLFPEYQFRNQLAAYQTDNLFELLSWYIINCILSLLWAVVVYFLMVRILKVYNNRKSKQQN